MNYGHNHGHQSDGGSGVTHLHVGGDIYCRGLGDLGLGVNLAQTLSQLRVLGQSLKKHPVCGEFTAQIKDIQYNFYV